MEDFLRRLSREDKSEAEEASAPFWLGGSDWLGRRHDAAIQGRRRQTMTGDELQTSRVGITGQPIHVQVPLQLGAMIHPAIDPFGP